MIHSDVSPCILKLIKTTQKRLLAKKRSTNISEKGIINS